MAFGLKRFAAFGLGMLALAPASAVDPTPADLFAKAVMDMRIALGPQEEDRVPPLATEPETRQRVAVITAAIDVFGTPAFPVRDYATFEDVCAPLNELTVRYQLSGMKALAPLKGKPAELYMPRMRALMTANGIKHQDIVIPLLSANVKCMALHMPVMERFWESLAPADRTPVRADGLAKMRNGTANMLVGIAVNGVDRGMTQANRTLAIKAAASYAPAFARTLPVARRKAVLQAISGSAPGLVDRYPEEYAAIALAFSQTECVALCLVP